MCPKGLAPTGWKKGFPCFSTMLQSIIFVEFILLLRTLLQPGQEEEEEEEEEETKDSAVRLPCLANWTRNQGTKSSALAAGSWKAGGERSNRYLLEIQYGKSGTKRNSPSSPWLKLYCSNIFPSQVLSFTSLHLSSRKWRRYTFVTSMVRRHSRQPRVWGIKQNPANITSKSATCAENRGMLSNTTAKCVQVKHVQKSHWEQTKQK